MLQAPSDPIVKQAHPSAIHRRPGTHYCGNLLNYSQISAAGPLLRFSWRPAKNGGAIWPAWNRPGFRHFVTTVLQGDAQPIL